MRRRTYRCPGCRSPVQYFAIAGITVLVDRFLALRTKPNRFSIKDQNHPARISWSGMIFLTNFIHKNTRAMRTGTSAQAPTSPRVFCERGQRGRSHHARMGSAHSCDVVCAEGECDVEQVFPRLGRSNGSAERRPGEEDLAIPDLDECVLWSLADH